MVGDKTHTKQNNYNKTTTKTNKTKTKTKTKKKKQKQKHHIGSVVLHDQLAMYVKVDLGLLNFLYNHRHKVVAATQVNANLDLVNMNFEPNSVNNHLKNKQKIKT